MLPYLSPCRLLPEDGVVPVVTVGVVAVVGLHPSLAVHGQGQLGLLTILFRLNRILIDNIQIINKLG